MQSNRNGNTVWTKLAVTALYFVLVAVLSQLGMNCIFQTFLRIPCPGCGMTRALMALCRLDFPAALRYHCMIFFMPLLYVYFLTDGKLFGEIADRVILCTVFSGFLIRWIVELVLYIRCR